MRNQFKRGLLGLAAAMALWAGVSGCETMSADPTGADGDNSNAVNSNANDNGSANSDDEPSMEPSDDTIPMTANSITRAAAGQRSDPEGVAPKADVTEVTWRDGRGGERTMTLGAYLYQYDFSFSDNQKTVTRSVNDDAWGHEGFGYVVSHNTATGNSPLGKANAATSVTTRILAGGHHAFHRIEMLYDRDKEGGGKGIKIPVVIEWFMATGRDHPIWSVTWKMKDVVNPQGVDFDAYRMDTRGPYGSLNFDGATTRAGGDAIGGISWGDAGFRFTTTDAQLTMNSPWRYDVANSVCFTRAWTAAVNAEMGIVQTRAGDSSMGYPERVDGRERSKTSAAAFTDKGDCNGFSDARVYGMPCVNGWPYQLMNYDWDPGTGKPLGEATGTKLIAWGTPYGWLGSSLFTGFDGLTADGRGDRSYATFIVVGPKSRFNAANGQFDLDGDVLTTVDAVESLSAALIKNVSQGAVVSTRPRGAGTEATKTVANGYDDTYAAFFIRATADGAAFTFSPAAGKPVDRPIFVLEDYSAKALPIVEVDGTAVTVNSGDASSGAFASIDGESQTLWVTLNRTISADAAIRIGQK